MILDKTPCEDWSEDVLNSMTAEEVCHGFQSSVHSRCLAHLDWNLSRPMQPLLTAMLAHLLGYGHSNTIHLPGTPTSACLMRTTARMTHCRVWGYGVAGALCAVNTHTWMSVCVCVCMFIPVFPSVSFLLCHFILFPSAQWLIRCSEAFLECTVMSVSLCHIDLFFLVPSVLRGICVLGCFF